MLVRRNCSSSHPPDLNRFLYSGRRTMIDQSPDTADTAHASTNHHAEVASGAGEKGSAATPAKEPVVITHPATLSRSPVWRAVTSPSPVTFICVVLMVALLSFGMGAQVSANSGGGSSTLMSGMSATPDPNVPDAKQSVGNQLAHYTLENGIKHFTFTAQQVMWQPLTGHRVLAWTLDGTVPGPMIRVTAGDHLHITIRNQLPASTAIHWHGLAVPMNADGVPGVGQDAIQSGAS